MLRRITDGTPLDLGDPRGYPDYDPRLEDRAEPPLGLCDQVAQHPLGDLEVRDDPVLQGLDDADVGRCPSQHPLGLAADGDDGAVGLVNGDDGRLAEDDTLATDEHEGVRRAQVDREVPRKRAQEHHRLRPQGTGASMTTGRNFCAEARPIRSWWRVPLRGTGRR